MGLIISYFDKKTCKNIISHAKAGLNFDYIYEIDKITYFEYRRYCIDETINQFAKGGYIKLLKQFNVFHLYNHKHIISASSENHIECVDFLLENIPSGKNHELLVNSILANAHPDCIMKISNYNYLNVYKVLKYILDYDVLNKARNILIFIKWSQHKYVDYIFFMRYYADDYI